MHSAQFVVDTVEGVDVVAAVLDGIDGNLSHGHDSDSPDIDQAGKLDRGSDHSHGRTEAAVVADRHGNCRVLGYCVERMNRLEEANARQELVVEKIQSESYS